MIVLASGSPRRRELLAQLGLDVIVRPPDIDESARAGEEPVAYVRRLSLDKAATAATQHVSDLVIAADTTVDLDGQILGKPVDAEHAAAMLRRIAGRSHRVHTGVTARRGGISVTDVVTTVVTFTPISAAAVDWYVGTGEPFGKAGGYALQGAGGVFVAAVDGSVSNVVGLPLATVVGLAGSLGVELLRPWPR